MRPNDYPDPTYINDYEKKKHRIYYRFGKLYLLDKIYEEYIIISTGCEYYYDAMTNNVRNLVKKSELENFIKIEPDTNYDFLVFCNVTKSLRVDWSIHSDYTCEGKIIVDSSFWNQEVEITIENYEKKYNLKRLSKLVRILKA